MKAQLYDYSNLRGLIIQKYGKYGRFAEAMGIRTSVLSMRLTNKTYWSQPDIDKACELLDIKDPKEYFFVRYVKDNFTDGLRA